MGPPRPILAALEGHDAVLRWGQDLGRVSKFLDPDSPQPGKTNLASCLFPPAFLEIELLKKKSMCAAFFSQTLCPFSEHPSFGHCFSKAAAPR